MSYKPFGKTKTITLPISVDDEEMSIYQYKEKYGIDLREIIDLFLDAGSGNIRFKVDALILVQVHKLNVPCRIFVPNKYYYVTWTSGETDGALSLTLIDYSGDAFDAGIALKIPYDKDFIIENLTITHAEL